MRVLGNGLSYLKYVLAVCLILFAAKYSIANESFELYAGQSTFASCPNPPRGAVYTTAWASKHSCVKAEKDGSYGAKITATSYFNGIAQVQCDYYYRWYVGTRQYTSHATTYYNVTCKPVNIRMNQSGPINLTSGNGIPLSVTLSPNISPSPTVYWQSSNSNIAEVGQNGYVTAKKSGEAVISASTSAGPDKATITVKVQAAPVEKAVISPSSIRITTNETSSLKLQLYPEYSTANSIKWESYNSSIASVSSNGVVSGIRPGSTRVYCTVDGWITSNYVDVEVVKPKLTLSADKPSGLYEKGTKITLTANKSGAKIFYTLDGTKPTERSIPYISPISLDKSVTLKALAIKSDCIDSDVLSIDYKITSLKLVSTHPENGSEVLWKNVVPSITFNDNVELINGGENITLKMSDNKIIEGRALVSGNTLSFVPDSNLKEGAYTLYIPAQAVISGIDEENFASEFTFKIKNNGKIMDIRAGHQATLILKADSTLWAWGRNDSGQLGNGTISNYRVSEPQKIMDNVGYIEATAGVSAAIKNNGDLYMWGSNSDGVLGNQSVKNSSKPVRIIGDIKKVVTSGSHTLAIGESGGLYSWGSNYSGELGIRENNNYKWSPRYVRMNIKDVAASDGLTLALTNDGELYTCGNGYSGQLGIGLSEGYSLDFKIIMEDCKKVAAMRDASLVLKNDGTLWSFGSNKYGQLGIGGDIDKSYSPLLIMSDVRDVDACWLNGAVIKNDNSLWIWGDNSSGQICNGVKSLEKQMTPVKVLDNVKTVSVGESHIIALTFDGTLYGWGDCYGYVGYADILTPMACPFFLPFTSPISLSLKNLTIRSGEKGVLLPSVTPASADYTDIEWISLNDEIATVSSFGVVEGKREGRTTIKCKIFVDGESYIVAESKVTVSYNDAPDDSFITLLDCTSEDGIKGWTIDHGRLSEPLTKLWEWRNYEGKYYLNVSAHVNGFSYESNGWAISPVIRLSNSAHSISFDHAAKFQSTLKYMSSICIRTSGSREWTKLEIPNWPSPGSWTFQNSGDIDVSAFAGKDVEIGINYVSDNTGADMWEIRDLKIHGVISDDGSSGVGMIVEDRDCETIYYNLQGVRVENPGRGVYIKMENGRSMKVVR